MRLVKLPPSPAGGRSKSRLQRRQPPEEPPRQPGVIADDEPMSLGNHGSYIDPCAGFDNECKRGRTPAPSCSPFNESLFLGVCRFGTSRARCFRNTSLFAAQAAQVIKLGAAHLAAAHYLDRVDHRRVKREHALNAFA